MLFWSRYIVASLAHAYMIHHVYCIGCPAILWKMKRMHSSASELTESLVKADYTWKDFPCEVNDDKTISLVKVDAPVDKDRGGLLYHCQQMFDLVRLYLCLLSLRKSSCHHLLHKKTSSTYHLTPLATG